MNIEKGPCPVCCQPMHEGWKDAYFLAHTKPDPNTGCVAGDIAGENCKRRKVEERMNNIECIRAKLNYYRETWTGDQERNTLIAFELALPVLERLAGDLVDCAGVDSSDNTCWHRWQFDHAEELCDRCEAVMVLSQIANILNPANVPTDAGGGDANER